MPNLETIWKVYQRKNYQALEDKMYMIKVWQFAIQFYTDIMLKRFSILAVFLFAYACKTSFSEMNNMKIQITTSSDDTSSVFILLKINEYERDESYFASKLL